MILKKTTSSQKKLHSLGKNVSDEVIAFYIKGTKVNLTTPIKVVDTITNHDYKKSGYISIFGLYVLSESFLDNKLQIALNSSLLNPLHGKVIEFYLKMKRYDNIKTVDGLYLLDKLLNKNLTHYFYGTNNLTLDKMGKKILNQYPDAKVLGYQEAPFIENDQIINNQLLIKDFQKINIFKPNVVWIGLGGIKQDLVMYNYSKYCTNSIMIGVGAAFDYFAGNISLSSEKAKSIGFRWLYRCLLQPKMFKRIAKLMKNFICQIC